MSWSAEEWSVKLSFYEKVADDESASPELRLAFARKANSLRILGRCLEAGAKSHRSAITPRARAEPEALLFSPTRLTASRIRQWRVANPR
jgi:hypothetical protein